MEEGLHTRDGETIYHVHVSEEAALAVASNGLTIINGQSFYIERIDTVTEHDEGTFAANVVLIPQDKINVKPFLSYAGAPIDSEG